MSTYQAFIEQTSRIRAARLYRPIPDLAANRSDTLDISDDYFATKLPKTRSGRPAPTHRPLALRL
ncbi:hypothetical protein [Burkholderia ambifaria]|uniref:hypothetical protein n=1 Tax=Burkholderia ambifaria TaxID=152480 RepID=UPI001ABB2AF5|nr:hypothetical protein [Burkholderia ambifaria]